MRTSSPDIPILGACGWVKQGHCGCVRKGLQWQYADFRSLCAQLLADNILTCPIDNFARFDQVSQQVIVSVALAVHDAGIVCAKDKKQDIGLLGTSPDGALASNLAYFKDYVEGGRKLGRAKFFIYTLPSSALAEAAIHFGLQGPLLYLLDTQQPKAQLLAQARLLIENKEAQAMLAVDSNSEVTECHFLPGEHA